jgi:DNA-binding NarL/FixJ family response regulator
MARPAKYETINIVDVLQDLADGFVPKEIAERRGYSENGLKMRLMRSRNKKNVRSTYQLVAQAMREGVVK